MAPKLFISYSWSNSEHEQWVIDLATQLRESGVDAILDKWDLKEGHDAVVFMEQMVSNPEIKKVVLICDRTYAEKANGRSGGVGTETQIISKEVYDNQSQDKFVAIVCEYDDEGNPFLPIYHKSRIYIDLSSEDEFSKNYEQLLRWIFDKPLHIKPQIGTPPAFLNDEEHISLGTTAAFKRCIDAIKNNRPHAHGSLGEYFTMFATHLENFRIQNDGEENFDDTLIRNIAAFLPYRNEAIQVFSTIAGYSPDENFIRLIHRFFENLIPYLDHPSHLHVSDETNVDNFKFIIHELFLYAIAIFLKHELFIQANHLLHNGYYSTTKTSQGTGTIFQYDVFYNRITSLKHRTARLGLRRISLHADLLNDRCTIPTLKFNNLMQADFIAFMRLEITDIHQTTYWWPETLAYASPGHTQGPFEVFARSLSKSYFDQVKVLLQIDSPADLEPLIKDYKERRRELPRWDYRSFSPLLFLGYEKLATRP